MNAGVVETCGKFERVIPPGCHCIMFPYETLSPRAILSLKVRHTEISCETKSKDNVFVTVIVAGRIREHWTTTILQSVF